MFPKSANYKYAPFEHNKKVRAKRKQASETPFIMPGHFELPEPALSATEPKNRELRYAATLSGVISGGFRITKINAGVLALSGTNTYSGGIAFKC